MNDCLTSHLETRIRGKVQKLKLILPDLCCSRCGNVSQSRIFSCSQGHPLCEVCLQTLLSCPICSERFELTGPSRNYLAERMIAHLQMAEVETSSEAESALEAGECILYFVAICRQFLCYMYCSKQAWQINLWTQGFIVAKASIHSFYACCCSKIWQSVWATHFRCLDSQLKQTDRKLFDCCSKEIHKTVFISSQPPEQHSIKHWWIRVVIWDSSTESLSLVSYVEFKIKQN